MYITWVQTNEAEQIFLSATFNKSVPVNNKITFQFGAWSKELTVRIDENLTDDTIGLSEELKREVFIPDELYYQLNLEAGKVILGPVIMYLVSDRFIKKLDKIKDRLDRISQHNGLIYVSAPSRINLDSMEIEGFYYLPATEKNESILRKATFKPPAAIIKRVAISPSLNKYLADITNGCVFNSRFFNKWDMWNWLSPNNGVKAHLPNTIAFKRVEDIEEMLKRYQTIYLKPRSGSRGKGIVQIKREDNLYHITDDKNIKATGEKLTESKVMEQIIKKKDTYMIQRGVPIQHNLRNVDFRMYVQKNETKNWSCTGLLARFAKPGSITTNLHHVDYILKGTEALKEMYHLDEEEAEHLEAEIQKTCLNACELLDEHGHFGDIAVDFILDHDKHLWILEMNKRYGYKSFLKIGDEDMFNKIISNQFAYASTITGFDHKHQLK
ncbi:YheC/YheD family protein [Alkalihalophilus marmarensis]|uniref:YheC/YheD family endospore coat-associated protein n=1 Tax=Alkalihalophilus marmarensis TaxID=521377 RepID=UPI002E210D5A|nr:YheC/YheD family protein [Alkalihalophilus marmarensis]